MKRNYLIISGILFLLFVAFTFLVAVFDVQPIGPQGSEVGFATINQFVFDLLGVHLIWYAITDWLGVVALLVAFGFAAAGLYQLVKGRSLGKVDRRLWILGFFYSLVIACYLFFEWVVINCRPVILGEGLEASYPSSHTMIVVCIMAAAAIQVHSFYPEKKKLCMGADIVSGLLMAVTVIGRLISGVHWFTDIVGGLLLSMALVVLYSAGLKGYLKE